MSKAIIGHVIFNVKDIALSEPFYDHLMHALGFLIDHRDEGEWGVMKSYMQDDHNLWIRYDKEKQSQPFIRDVGLDHLAFKVDSVEEVDRLFKIAQKLGAKITRPPEKRPEYTPSYYAFYFRDPDGIPLEVYFQ